MKMLKNDVLKVKYVYDLKDEQFYFVYNLLFIYQYKIHYPLSAKSHQWTDSSRTTK